MSMYKAIRARLIATSDVTDVVGARIYSEVAPQTVDNPNIVFNVITISHENTMSTAASYATARVQVDCRATTRSAAGDLKDKVRVSLDDYSGTSGSVVISSVAAIMTTEDLEESEGVKVKRLYISRIEFDVFYAL